MSMNNLTIDGEFRYIVQWFNEWSELQRDDFVPILVNYITDANTNDDDDDGLTATAITPVNMNGLPNDIEFNGRPMSLFQCRIKLFNQWNRKWPAEFKEKLQQKITEIDGKVGEKIKLALKPNNGSLTNGYASNENSLELMNSYTSDLSENDKEKVEAVNNGMQVVALNDPMTEVLNNETSVDDIETNEDVNNSSRCIEQSLLNDIVTTTAHHTDYNKDKDDEDGGNGNGNNDDNDDCNNTRHNHAINEREPVEQVVQMQNLKINEENEETAEDEENDHEDVTATVEQKQQLPSVTVTVNPAVVAQTITTNTEVPLVV